MAVLDHGIKIHFMGKQEMGVRVVAPRVTTQAIVVEMGQELRARVMRALLDLRTMFQAAAVVRAVQVQLVDLMGRQPVDPVCKIAF